MILSFSACGTYKRNRTKALSRIRTFAGFKGRKSSFRGSTLVDTPNGPSTFLCFSCVAPGCQPHHCDSTVILLKKADFVKYFSPTGKRLLEKRADTIRPYDLKSCFRACRGGYQPPAGTQAKSLPLWGGWMPSGRRMRSPPAGEYASFHPRCLGLLPLIFIMCESFFPSHRSTPVLCANSFAPRVNCPGQITAAYSQP